MTSRKKVSCRIRQNSGLQGSVGISGGEIVKKTSVSYRGEREGRGPGGDDWFTKEDVILAGEFA